MSNELVHHANLYLRQHGHNPVDWKAWTSEAWEIAKEQNKLVIVSIGYSACHWCHVMEKNCFEDADVGSFMNQHFISIKVDREERPDIDQTYMSAIQAMGKNGGWPLNCVCLPDARPIFAGTYIPKIKWLQTLQELHHLFHHDHDTVIEFASQLENHLVQTRDLFDISEKYTNSFDFELWLSQLDHSLGGTTGSPKFPMPPLLLFVLKKSLLHKNVKGIQWIETTLNTMALGGLWDWIDGGFSRYSVDERWHIPHFEKMLYDNAQLLEVYAFAKNWIQNSKWDFVIKGTQNWLQDFLLNQNGLYYSATDADSEGEEGKYFSFSKKELEISLGNNFDTADLFFDFENNSYWEHDSHVLRIKDIEAQPSQEILCPLKEVRSKKIRPATDNKVLLSWNALLLHAMAKEKEGHNAALYLWQQIKKHLLIQDQWVGTLYDDGSIVSVQLDGLAFLQRALLQLLMQTGEVHFWEETKKLQGQMDLQFKDSHSPYYFSGSDPKLFIQPKDIHDNVIPSANAIVAENLYWMGIIGGSSQWIEQSKSMTFQRCQFQSDPFSMAHWMQVALLFEHKANIIASTEVEKNLSIRLLLHRTLLFNSCMTELPLLQNKERKDKVYYVCNSETCLAPTSDISFLLV